MQRTPKISSLACALFAFGIAAAAPAVRVGLLANHQPTAWSSDTDCAASSLATVKCNLGLVELAIATAAADGVQMLVLPEGYGLTGGLAKDGFFDLQAPLPARGVGTVPCTDMSAVDSPLQVGVSCAARKGSITVAANFFTRMANGTRRITEYVFDPNGKVLAVYDKNHLWPGEGRAVTPGPFAPTTVTTLGRVWGLVICYEGFYPEVTGDYSQMIALQKRNATTILWSVGSTVGLLATDAKLLAKRFQWQMAGTEDAEVVIHKSSTALLGPSGEALAARDVPVANASTVGYTGMAIVRSAVF